jgi:hypothetical protein
MKYFLSILTLSFVFLIGKSQDIFLGNWNSKSINSNLNISIKIGTPEKNILYPAELTLDCDSFHASYQMLLAKKNSRQLAIGKVKFPLNETPFSIGNWTVLLNGTLDFSKNIRGKPTLSVNKIITKDYEVNLPEEKSFSKSNIVLARKLHDFLDQEEINFEKTNDNSWSDSTTFRITQPKQSSTYFGVIDTLFVTDRNASAHFESNRDIDIVTLKLNESTLLDQIDSKKTRDNEDFNLDTGLNIILFFADDFGKKGTSSAKVNIILNNASKLLDFTDKNNLASNFIALKVYLKHNPDDDTKFQEYYSGDWGNSSSGNYNNATSVDKNGKQDKAIGTLVSKSQQLTFAIWDDAVEDGDTISLSINDKWIVKGFPVLKKPQYLTVTLQPGPNVITFMADNLGSIVPNTSVLEVIDGKKRKSFFIETDLDTNNLIKIYYDTRTN